MKDKSKEIKMALHKGFMKKLPVIIALLVIALFWQLICSAGIVPAYMLPSPLQVASAFASDIDTIMLHARVTILEAVLGLVIGVALGFIMAVVMDRFRVINRALYPIPA